jgi:hypothetical protein
VPIEKLNSLVISDDFFSKGIAYVKDSGKTGVKISKEIPMEDL